MNGTTRHRWVLACILLTSCVASGRLPTNTSEFHYDRSVPLEFRVFTTDTLDGYARLTATYRSAMEGTVPADLFVPLNGGAGARSAIVFLHGLPGAKESMLPLAASYARAGVVTLSISAPFDRQDLSYRKEEDPRLLPAPLFNEYDRREMVQVVLDVSRGMDLLIRDFRVDSSTIGFVGFSFGGSVGALLTAVDPRLRVAALMSPTSGLATWTRLAGDHHVAKHYFLELPKRQQQTWLASMDSVEPWRFLQASRFHVPILIQAGLHDASVSRADVTHLIKAGGDRITVEWLESGHLLPPSAQISQARFLARYLNINVDAFVPTRDPIR